METDVSDISVPSGLNNSVVLITGGTAGVGLEVASRFARAGAAIVINGRSATNGSAALERLSALTSRVRFHAGDCSDYSVVENAVDVAVTEFGNLDVLVSAGAQGATPPTPFAEMTHAELKTAFETRFFPRVIPILAAVPALERGGGSVVLLTTDAARHPTVGESVIGAVGAAIVLMTKTLAKELAPSKIRVNSVSMTLTSDTPSWDRIFAGEGFERSLFEAALRRFPFGRPPNAGEVAQMVTFLASDLASQVTGQTVSVNGGLSFGGW